MAEIHIATIRLSAMKYITIWPSQRDSSIDASSISFSPQRIQDRHNV